MMDVVETQDKGAVAEPQSAGVGLNREDCQKARRELCSRSQISDTTASMTVDYNPNLPDSKQFADELQTILVDYSVSRTYLRNIIRDVSEYAEFARWRNVDFPLLKFRFRVPDDKSDRHYHAYIELPSIQRDEYGINTMSINTTFNFAHLNSENPPVIPEAIVSDELSDLRHFMAVFLKGVQEGLSPELSSAVAFSEMNVPEREAFSLAIAHESLNYLVKRGMVDPNAKAAVRADQIVEARAKLSESDYKEIARMINHRAILLGDRYEMEEDKLEIDSKASGDGYVLVTASWHRNGIKSSSCSSKESSLAFSKLKSSNGRVLLEGSEERRQNFLQRALNDNGLLSLKIVSESGSYRVVYQPPVDSQ
jgi:hypothetical protein